MGYYAELARRLRRRYLDSLWNVVLQKPEDVYSDCNHAATAITDLLARAEAAEDALSGKLAGHKEAGEAASKLLAYAKGVDIPEEIRDEMHAAAIMLFGVDEALSAAEDAEGRLEEAMENAAKWEGMYRAGIGLSAGFVSLHEEIAHWRERAEAADRDC